MGACFTNSALFARSSAGSNNCRLVAASVQGVTWGHAREAGPHPRGVAGMRGGLHFSYSCAPPILTTALVTHDPQRSFGQQLLREAGTSTLSCRKGHERPFANPSDTECHDHHVLVLGVPSAEIMGVIGIVALAANVASVLLLMRYKDGDASVRSVWLCSRNDAIGNVAVMGAALAVWGTTMAGLFLMSSSQILLQAWREYTSEALA